MASDGMFRNQRTPNWKSNVVKHTFCHSVNNRRRKFHAGWIADHSFVMVDKIGKEQIKTGWNRIIPVFDGTLVTPPLLFSVWDEKKNPKKFRKKLLPLLILSNVVFPNKLFYHSYKRGHGIEVGFFYHLFFQPAAHPNTDHTHRCLTSLIERRNYFQFESPYYLLLLT
jgi:hypothetical protein